MTDDQWAVAMRIIERAVAARQGCEDAAIEIRRACQFDPPLQLVRLYHFAAWNSRWNSTTKREVS